MRKGEVGLVRDSLLRQYFLICNYYSCPLAMRIKDSKNHLFSLNQHHIHNLYIALNDRQYFLIENS